MATDDELPADIFEKLLPPRTETGDEAELIDPSPRNPLVLLPQEYAKPLVEVATTKLPFVDAAIL